MGLLAVVTVVALGAVACAAGTESGSGSGSTSPVKGPSATVDEGAARNGGTIVFAVPSESNGYNPIANQWTDSGSMVGSSVFEPLAAVGPDKRAQPFLAESWTPNATNTSWTVKLRQGVTFHNGEAFDAMAVKTNFEAFLGSLLTSMALKGVLQSMTVVDDHTIRFDMAQPWGAFPDAILAGPFYMMAPEMIQQTNAGAESNPIGTGPFRFDSWQHDISFKVVKNPNYWQKGLPHLDGIEFRFITDPSSRINSLNSGDVDALLTTRESDAVSAEGKGDTVIKDWNSENVFAETNVSPQIDGTDTPNPMANTHARQALAFATDREEVANLVGDNIEIPTSPWAPDNTWGMPEDQNGYVPFDLERAKAEVEAYKKDTGQTTLAFTLSGFSSAEDLKLMQVLQSQWNAAGMDVSLEQLEESAFISKTITSKYQVAISRNYAFPDPDTAFSFWSSTTAQGSGKLSINMTQYTTPELDAALKKGRESTDLKTRQDAYHEVARQLNKGFTHIWLYRTPYSLISKPEVKGWNTPRAIGFSAYGPRTWLGELWLAS